MNDVQKYFPNNQLQSLADDLVNVKSWDDFARRFLLGTGNAKNTNQTYLTACKQFYDFTGGLHPMQAGTPEWIEQFYDSLPEDLNTRAVKVAALKFMYRRIIERYPAYQNPFNIMCERLQAKLNRTKRDESERDSLTAKEYQGLLKMLRQYKTLRGIQDYGFVRFAVTSGLRAAELVSLTFGQVSEIDGVFKATFTGKGSKVRTVQVEAEALRVLRKAFRMRYGRQPGPEDRIFHGTGAGRGVNSPGITKSALHRRLTRIIETAKAQGIIRNNLHVSTHTMRHTCATLALENGIPIDQVQKMLGHSNLATTARYLHSRVDMREAWGKMEGAA